MPLDPPGLSLHGGIAAHRSRFALLSCGPRELITNSGCWSFGDSVQTKTLKVCSVLAKNGHQLNWKESDGSSKEVAA